MDRSRFPSMYNQGQTPGPSSSWGGQKQPGLGGFGPGVQRPQSGFLGGGSNQLAVMPGGQMPSSYQEYLRGVFANGNRAGLLASGTPPGSRWSGTSQMGREGALANGSSPDSRWAGTSQMDGWSDQYGSGQFGQQQGNSNPMERIRESFKRLMQGR